jgi:dienelactone hydrolase
MALAPELLQAAAAVVSEDIQYARGGETVKAFVARPRSGQGPVVAVAHGNWGVPRDVRDMALTLAAWGYTALAVNPTSREPDHTRIPRAFLMSQAYADRYVADIRAGVREIGGGPKGSKQAVWGYCGGGYVGLLWGGGANGSELGAVVGAHVAMRNRNPDGTPLTSRPPGITLLAATKAPVQLHLGTGDPLTPSRDIAELQAQIARGRPRTELYLYKGAAHGFAMHTNPNYRADYTRQVVEGGRAFLRRWLPT